MLESLLGWNHLSFFLSFFWCEIWHFLGGKKNCSKFNDFYLLKKIAIF
jgi:hypothetical protein